MIGRSVLCAALLAAGALLAGCSGGGGGSTPPVTHTPTPAPTGSPGTAQAVITIDWPAAQQSSAHRAATAGRAKPSYISASTNDVDIYQQPGGTGTPTYLTSITNPCGSGNGRITPNGKIAAQGRARALSCSQTSTVVSLSPGYNVFYAAGYDGTSQGSGNLLSVSTTGTGITIAAPPASNLVTVTMNGIVSNVKFSSNLSGSNETVTVNGVDADGNVISSGSFANGPITVTYSDQYGEFTGFPSTPPTFTTSGGTISLTYQGSNDCTATVYGSAPAYAVPAQLGGGTFGGVTNATATLQAPTGVNPYAHPHFGRFTVCWPTFGASPTYYYVYRGTSAHGESSTAIAAVPSTSLGYEDYTVTTGNTYYYKVCTGALGGTCEPEFSSSLTNDPLNLVSGMKPTFWFDANDTSTISSTSWADKSTNGNNLTTASVTSVASPYGNLYRNALSFGSGSYATTSTGNVATTLTVIAVASQSGAGSSGFQRLINLGTGDARGFVGTANSGQVATFWGNTLTSPSYGACNGWCDMLPNGPATTWPWGGTNLPSIVEVVNDGSCPAYICGSTSGLMGPITYYNGVAMQQSQNGVMTATTGMEIGAYNNSPVNTGQSWYGTVDDILIYATNLSSITNAGGTTATAQQVIEGYEACKWGTQASLPSSHPFYLGKACP